MKNHRLRSIGNGEGLIPNEILTMDFIGGGICAYFVRLINMGTKDNGRPELYLFIGAKRGGGGKREAGEERGLDAWTFHINVVGIIFFRFVSLLIVRALPIW